MKIIIENQIKELGPDTGNEFMDIINELFTGSLLVPTERYNNWFFYRGSNHLAIHQKLKAGKVLPERIIFIDYSQDQ